jgi:type IV secretory pathway TraG/TraD family ATPase VirD4
MKKSILRIFCRPQFGESSTMGSIFWDRLGAPLFGLKYCNIPPSLQPALELLWTFTISIFNLNPLPQQDILIRIAFAILLFATFSQSLNSDEED